MRALCLAALIATAAVGDIEPLPDATVRVAYLIPSNRAAQVDGVANLETLIATIHAWSCEQMDRNGFGPVGFRYETQADGLTPLVHVVPVTETDAYLREDVWSRVNAAAGDAGVPVWTPGEVWLLVPEIHLQGPDGSIAGGVALGASFGSGDDPGVAIIGSVKLSLASRAGLSDDTPYAGLVVPDIGPYPLVQNVSFPWFEGTTVSSVVSSFYGATMHELGHALGLAHDARNDSNFHGNLMFNGLRGFRGTVFPDLYPDDHTRLAYASAAMLSVRPYFSSCISAAATEGAAGAMAPPPPIAPRKSHDFLGPDDRPDPFPTRRGDLEGADDGMAPVVVIHTSGAVDPVDGLVEIAFDATDDVGLAVIVLRRGGAIFDEILVSGTAVSTSFRTPWYDPGVEHDFYVMAMDASGNRANVGTLVTANTGFDRAPQPFVRITPPQAKTGADVLLDASGTVDPEAGAMTYEWDLDGDGTFDTGHLPDPTHVTSYAVTAAPLVRVRVTDPAGAAPASTPVALRVTAGCPDTDGNGVVDIDDLLAVLGEWGACPGCAGDVNGDDVVDIDDLLAVLGSWGPCP